MENLEKKFSFTDKNGIIFEIEASIKNGRFSIVGTGKDGEETLYGGQVVDEITPKNEAQEKLIKVWKKWHLNDLHAGTIRQEKELEGVKGDYSAHCKHLEKIGLLVDNGYRYGSGWLTRELPFCFDLRIKSLIAEINRAEKSLTIFY